MSRSTVAGKRRSAWVWVSAALMALWLLAGGCDGEQGDNTSETEEPAAPGTTTIRETSQAATAKLAFVSDRAGNNDIYLMDSDGSNQRRITKNPATDQQPALSPDGEKVAFVSDRDGNPEVYVMDSDGSNQRRITNDPQSDENPTFLLDGRLVFVRAPIGTTPDGRNPEMVYDGDVYVVNADGSGQGRLTDYPQTTLPDRALTDRGSFNPTFSSQGKLAVQSSRLYNSEILLMNAGGSDISSLTLNKTGDVDPAFSPDGSQIALATEQTAGNFDVYTMNPDGTNKTRLTKDPAHDRYPAFSPDGSTIAFTSDRNGNDDIYVMGSDGSGPRRLTNDPANDQQPAFPPGKVVPESAQGADEEDQGVGTSGTGLTPLTRSRWAEHSPVFSPKGKKIAFVRNEAFLRLEGNNLPPLPVENDIYVMNADGTGQMSLTNDSKQARSPAWSPDGEKIVFVDDRDGKVDIYVMDSDGSNQRRITNTLAGEGDPTISPDGKRVAFYVPSLEGTLDVYVMNLDGSNRKRLTNDEASETGLAFSPDGQKIAFSRSAGEGGVGFRIYVMDSDGTSLKMLTGDEEGYWVAEDWDPAWSPDGDRIAFESTRDGNPEIYVMDSDGTNEERLTDSPWNDSDPAFSSDGNKVAFVTDRDGSNEIYVATVDDGK